MIFFLFDHFFYSRPFPRMWLLEGKKTAKNEIDDSSPVLLVVEVVPLTQHSHTRTCTQVGQICRGSLYSCFIQLDEALLVLLCAPMRNVIMIQKHVSSFFFYFIYNPSPFSILPSCGQAGGSIWCTHCCSGKFQKE